ncbi:MAG TPA: HD domain-containing phosphohydrolase [Bryobacteraceae bacterium]|jgi:diguanylate cyclase (GGDEF)-like protein/putative nucleotidyltransferase with HDIG domain|nr:HD domain-containing phosphohydrolase [Bryobacteraceae bacterium]
MNTLTEMPPAARAYWFCVIACGSLCFLLSVLDPAARGVSAVRLSIYLITAIVISGLKIRLPGIFGTLSMNYIVIIAALLNINLAAGMIVAVISTLGQCVIHAVKKPRWFQVLFSTAGVAIPVLAAWFTLHLPLLTEHDSTGSFSLLAASLVYFLITTAMVAGIIGLTNGKNVIEVWRTSYLWTSVHYLVGGCIAEAVHFLDKHIGSPALVVAILPLYLLYRTYSVYVTRMEEQQQHTTQMAQLHLRTIETLALAIDAKDDTTAAHLRRVQTYAIEIGNELKLSPLEMQALEAAALLHDVGKLAVPEYIISKPGKLTPEEFEKMKVHPVVGAELLERVGFPYPVVPIVRSHHEKFDGTGYPDGLVGEQIPIGARILSAIDCLDALASDRQYRKALPLDEAMEYVAKQSGKSFDPVVVNVLQKRYRELEIKAKAAIADCVKLSSHIKVERGVAPAAGFAQALEAVPAKRCAEPGMTTSGARREFQRLIETTNDAGGSFSLDETLALVAARLQKIIEYDTIAIYLLENGKLLPRFVKGESFRLFSSLEIPLGQGLSGWVAENDSPIVNGNPAVEPGYLSDPSKVTALRSAIAVPLRANDTVIGVLTLYHLGADAFSRDDQRLLLAIAPKAGLAIRDAMRFETAALAADRDELTGLANSRFLFPRLKKEVEKACRPGGSLRIAIIDVDGFKAANENLGHLAGDKILRDIAASLGRIANPDDVIARLGGDEFVLVTSADVPDIARIQRAIDPSVSISIGVSNCPEDGSDAETLLEKAEERMSEAKHRKRFLHVA